VRVRGLLQSKQFNLAESSAAFAGTDGKHSSHGWLGLRRRIRLRVEGLPLYAAEKGYRHCSVHGQL